MIKYAILFSKTVLITKPGLSGLELQDPCLKKRTRQRVKTLCHGLRAPPAHCFVVKISVLT